MTMSLSFDLIYILNWNLVDVYLWNLLKLTNHLQGVLNNTNILTSILNWLEDFTISGTGLPTMSHNNLSLRLSGRISINRNLHKSCFIVFHSLEILNSIFFASPLSYFLVSGYANMQSTKSKTHFSANLFAGSPSWSTAR